VVSHDERLTERLARRIRLAAGRIAADTVTDSNPPVVAP
jgi:putative ABC transport system ATP-binding protein